MDSYKFSTIKKLVIDGSVTDLVLTAITGAIIGFYKSVSPAGAVVGNIEGVAPYACKLAQNQYPYLLS
ncbi:MAG: hypothetical protein EOM05_05255 [Clostridia bacterium]|nr:hypothetical protein [Erysipelotrichia bacterium]NCC87258.1 hypothetical protein [Clostridia bacterium]